MYDKEQLCVKIEEVFRAHFEIAGEFEDQLQKALHELKEIRNNKMDVINP
ncbi:hypothetical protein ACFLZM_02235 [Thermodesulfobacteriota bacterium]